MKNILTVILLTISLFFISGCASRQNNGGPSRDENLGIMDFVANEEFRKENKLTLADLRDLLESSNMVEVKNLENQLVGQLVNDENIMGAVEEIFSLRLEDSYKDFARERVIATINFFSHGDYPIYGLIKEKFIYIEGYYFIGRGNNDIEKIIEYFELRTDAEPID